MVIDYANIVITNSSTWRWRPSQQGGSPNIARFYHRSGHAIIVRKCTESAMPSKHWKSSQTTNADLLTMQMEWIAELWNSDADTMERDQQVIG